MVEIAANNGERHSIFFWIRILFVTVTALGTIVATFIYNYFNTLCVWYFEPLSGHVDLISANYYAEQSIIVLYFVGSFVGLCCVGSVGMLAGTIYWVRKISLKTGNNEVKAGSLDYRMVFSHIALLLA